MKFNELSQELQELWTRGVDHSVFNEEWAGGVVKFNATFDTQYFKHIFTDQIQSVFCPFNMLQHERYSLLSVAQIDSRFSMATPSECAEAGIDYVPFMGWRYIESAPTDTHVLLKHESQGAVIGTRNPRFEAGTPCFFSEQVKTGYRQDVKNFDALAWMPMPLV